MHPNGFWGGSGVFGVPKADPNRSGGYFGIGFFGGGGGSHLCRAGGGGLAEGGGDAALHGAEPQALLPG